MLPIFSVVIADLTDHSGFCSNLVFYRIGPLAWRFQLAAAFAHRYKDSFRSFCRLRNSEVIAARDLVSPRSNLLACRY
jgi:hypothetical protein